MSRLSRLQARLAKERVDCLLIASPANLRYLTGFTGSAGLLIVEERGATFYTDGRYTLQAAEEVKSARLVAARRGALEAVLGRLRRSRHRRIGFETGLGYQQYQRLVEELGSKRLRPVRSAVEDLRLVKDEREIAAVKASVELNSKVFDDVLPLVRVGLAERDLAAEIEFRMRRRGAEKPAFETIVAGGPRSALPHARPTARPLGKNEFLLLDLGAILDGYVSDMTRTVFLGSANGPARSLYSTVQEAQQKAREAVRAGVSCAAVDRAARHPIASRGWGKFFPHSTGHGVGIEIHEMPRIAAREKTILPAGALVTIEPGVYLPGLGGVRIEDVVVVREGGAEVLTPTPRELLEL